MPFTFITSSEPGTIITDPRFVGFEIECEAPDDSEILEDDYPTTYVEHHSDLDGRLCEVDGDGSLHNGVELRTYPAQLMALEKSIQEQTEFLRKSGFEAEGRCGLHVHIDARDIKNKPVTIARIYKTIFAFEEVIYSLCDSLRHSNHFCYPIRSRNIYNQLPEDGDYDEVMSKYFKISKNDYVGSGRTQGTHYSGFNLSSIQHRGTIEFRYHEGTLDSRVMLNWAALLQRFFSYAINDFDEKTIRDFLMNENDRTREQSVKEMMKILNLPLNIKGHLLRRFYKNNPTSALLNAAGHPVVKTVTPPVEAEVVSRFAGGVVVNRASAMAAMMPEPPEAIDVIEINHSDIQASVIDGNAPPAGITIINDKPLSVNRDDDYENIPF